MTPSSSAPPTAPPPPSRGVEVLQHCDAWTKVRNFGEALETKMEIASSARHGYGQRSTVSTACTFDIVLASSLAMMKDMIGEAIKDFRVLERYDDDGFARLYVAEHVVIKTTAIIRLLDGPHATDPRMIDRYFNGAIAANQVKHAGVVQIYDAGLHHGNPYLIEELLEGETLNKRLQRGPLPIIEIVYICRELVSILLAMQHAAVVHRDLKPRYVFLARDPAFASGERVKLTHFGLAKRERSPRLTAENEVFGTPPYMSPEQWQSAGDVTTATDVYALGCMIFEMCCGRRPFQGATITDYLEVHANHVAPRARDLVPELPIALDQLIADMLAKAPAERPSLEALQRWFATPESWQ